MLDPVCESDQGKRFARPLFAFCLADARVQGWQFDILESGGARKQIETLKNESYFAIANGGQFLLAEAGHLDSLEQIAPGARLVEATQTIHERRFTAPAGAHDGDEIPARDFSGCAAQSVDTSFSELVVFMNRAHKDYGFPILRSG